MSELILSLLASKAALGADGAPAEQAPAPGGMYHLIYDGGWKTEFVGEQCCGLLGCGREGFAAALNASLLRDGEGERPVSAILDGLAKEEGSLLVSGEARYGNGDFRPMRSSFASHRGSDGRMHLYGSIVDITMPKRTIEALNSLISGYRAGLERLGGVIYCYIVKDRSAFVYSGREGARGGSSVIAGFPEWSVETGRVAPESAEEWRGLFDEIHRNEKNGSAEVTLLREKGPVRCRVMFTGIADAQGRNTFALITYEDVTDRYEKLHKHEMDKAGLIKVTQLVFPEIVFSNLTKGVCDVVQSLKETPREIELEKFLNARLRDIAPEDHEGFMKQFFPANQLAAIQKGRDRFQLTYRRRGADGKLHWIETIGLRQENPYNDDVLLYAVSRNVDQQKAQEELLRRALAESTDKLEGWLYYNSLSSMHFPGLVYVNYEDGRPSPYSVGMLAERLDCPAKELAMSNCFRIPEEDRGALQAAYDRARAGGESAFQAEYRVESDRGEMAWVYNHAVRFEDKYGDGGYIHFLTDTTSEHMLMEQLQENMEERLKASEQVFDIVAQHSNRTLYKYDIASCTTAPWNEESASRDIMAHMYAGNYSEEALEQNQFVMPESTETVKAFFTDIHGGVPSGEMNIHIKLADGDIRWYHFHYSSLFEGGRPRSALISIEDITERHELELAYIHHEQAVLKDAGEQLLHVQSCLTCDRVEKLSGSLLTEEEKRREYTHNEFIRMLFGEKFGASDSPGPAEDILRANLLDLYGRGERRVLREMFARFEDGSQRWMEIDNTIISDPFNDHVKVFTRIRDITEEKRASLTLRRQADYDAMTGLLRRGVGEERIRAMLAARRSPGGILLIIDLDDLKGINDTLGHGYGDKAINGIADTMKAHFRKDDILIRFGGDEFMAFLPGAELSEEPVSRSIKSLLKKIESIPLGDNNERSLRCSIGCAVELPDTDTFDSLYQRADIALYHVKRGGKNNFAFFEPEMLESQYRFKAKRMMEDGGPAAGGAQLRQLLAAVAIQYPGVVLFNLTMDYFSVLSSGAGSGDIGASDSIEAFWQSWRKKVHPDDIAKTLSALSTRTLTELFAEGQKRVIRCFRRREAVGYVRTEVDARLFANEKGEVCAFLLFRWDRGSEGDQELLSLNSILSSGDIPEYEMVSIVDTRDMSFKIFSHDAHNGRLEPGSEGYEKGVRSIAGAMALAGGAEGPGATAAEGLMRRLDESGGCCSLRCADGGAQLEYRFRRHEGSPTGLLITVHRTAEHGQ